MFFQGWGRLNSQISLNLQSRLIMCVLDNYYSVYTEVRKISKLLEELLFSSAFVCAAVKQKRGYKNIKQIK